MEEVDLIFDFVRSSMQALNGLGMLRREEGATIPYKAPCFAQRAGSSHLAE